MSTVNYSLKHKGVRLIPADKAWKKAKNGNLKLNPTKFLIFIWQIYKKLKNF